ncbi:MAG: adenosine deaminase family protein [Fimbriimonadaceae bacterium]|nr:adenosine deaminase family protein [Fimbriimonadaceae bacterium]
MPELRERLARLPKAELHCHLRGAMPLALFREQFERYGPAQAVERASPRLRGFWEQYPNLRPFVAGAWHPADLEGLFRYDDFTNFLATFAFTGFFFRTTDDFARLLTAVQRSLASQGIVYAELTVSVREYLLQGIPLDGLLEALDTHAVAGLQCQYLVDLVRDFGPEAGLTLLQEIAALAPQRVIGLTIGGSEHRCPPGPFAGCYALARELGWRRSVHAGEGAGPDGIREALRELQPERIGHGIRAIEDPRLVAELAARQIPLEVCPTSNRWTGVVPDLRQHPVAALYRAGVAVSISTDDPTFFGCTLVDELLLLRELGLREAEVLEIAGNGFRQAFLGDEPKARLLQTWTAALAE